MNYHVDKRIRPPLTYYGGKTIICQQILDVAPPQSTYVECFAGGLSVFFNKYRSDVEVVCDVSPELILFYHVLAERCEELIERMQGIKFEKASLMAARLAGTRGDELTRAINFLCRQRMSYSGAGGWAEGEGKVAAWATLPYDLRIAAKRLKGVKILLKSAFEVIPEYDSPDTFYYVDPPYYSTTRVSGNEYLYELKGMEHLRLLRLLSTLQGHVVLSGYALPMYDKELPGWDRVEIDIAAFSSPARGKKTRRTEVLWVKPQPSMF